MMADLAGMTGAAPRIGDVERQPGALSSQALVLCDHASNAIPAAFGTLGLAPGQLERHIAYDIGAAWVSRRLAGQLGCPALLSTFSRLLIDPNRGLDDPTLVMQISDGAIIPGNARIAPAAVEERIAAFYAPYDSSITSAVSEALAAGLPPAVISVHSFTPAWRAQVRPWHIGLLWDQDDRLVAPLFAALRADPDLVVGDNEPYAGWLHGDTIDRHATRHGLPNVLVELRQDLIDTQARAEAWADRLAAMLKPVLASWRARSRPADRAMAGT